eukprot:756479-Hanusia_phi.AAC.1
MMSRACQAGTDSARRLPESERPAVQNGDIDIFAKPVEPPPESPCQLASWQMPQRSSCVCISIQVDLPINMFHTVNQLEIRGPLACAAKSDGAPGGGTSAKSDPRSLGGSRRKRLRPLESECNLKLEK